MNKEKEIIKLYFQELLEKDVEICQYKKANMDITFIPDEMVDKNKNGYWKLLEMQNIDNQIEEIEKKFCLPLPNIFKAFISTYCHVIPKLEGVLNDYFGERDCVVQVEITPQIANAPLGEIINVLEQFDDLVVAGYFPFGDLNGNGPLCLDTKLHNKIVWFDHELYYRCRTRQEYEMVAVDMFDDFYGFLDCFFKKKN